jgi:hypothetical protein
VNCKGANTSHALFKHCVGAFSRWFKCGPPLYFNEPCFRAVDRTFRCLHVVTVVTPTWETACTEPVGRDWEGVRLHQNVGGINKAGPAESCTCT